MASTEIMDSITQIIILFGVGVPMSFIIDEIFENEIFNKIAYYSFIFIFFSFIYMSRQVYIKDKIIFNGINFFGLLFKSSSFLISEIDEIYLNQNDEDYFEIKIKIKDNSEFVIKKLPNKNPALAELELIKEHIKLAQNEN